ncbi:MAG TPA: YetF domain-containing protein [Gaiellaceae bacterium]|nr:YetF domain-containing protein [Gaiellaceae bacterium]
MDIVLRAIVLYAFVVFVMRVIGRRELSSLSAIDLVLLIVLGDAIQQGLTQDDYSVTGAIIAVSTIAAVQVGVSQLSYRSRRARRVLEGEPVVIIQDGKLIDRNMKRERLTEGEVAEEMRGQQIASVQDVEWGILESNGTMSFIPK